jgi:hypothetical protein
LPVSSYRSTTPSSGREIAIKLLCLAADDHHVQPAAVSSKHKVQLLASRAEQRARH